MHSNRPYEAGRVKATQDLGLHPVQPPAPWTKDVGLPVRTGSAVEKKAFEGSDRIPGGPADNRKVTEFDPKQLRKGQHHEMEHTNDPALAREIASDHLVEHPHYYEGRITHA